MKTLVECVEEGKLQDGRKEKKRASQCCRMLNASCEHLYVHGREPVAFWCWFTSPDRLELEQKRKTGNINAFQGLVWALGSKPWAHISQKNRNARNLNFWVFSFRVSSCYEIKEIRKWPEITRDLNKIWKYDYSSCVHTSLTKTLIRHSLRWYPVFILYWCLKKSTSILCSYLTVKLTSEMKTNTFTLTAYAKLPAISE